MSIAAGAGRPWGVAVLVCAAVCSALAPVMFAELQRHGAEHFGTPQGSAEMLGFLRVALLYPGLVLPAIVVLVPRWSAPLCGLLSAGCMALLVLAFLGSPSPVHALAFWGGRVLPAVLACTATLVAFRRRDGRAIL